MRPLRNIFMGLTVGSALNTVVMIIADQSMLIGPFAFATVVLGSTAIAIHYVDWRLRQSLLDLLQRAEHKVADGAEYSLFQLQEEIENGLSLTIAAKRVGELAHEHGFPADIESPHV